jgi:tetraacyldisaccharide 4'-kinase
MRYGELYPLDGCSKKEISRKTDVLLVTGIARPESLIEKVESTCGKVSVMRYADHHNFTANDFKDIENRYNNLKSDNKIIITTEKDATRILQHANTGEVITKNTYVQPIEIEILNDKDMFNKIILDYVTENSRNS